MAHVRRVLIITHVAAFAVLCLFILGSHVPDIDLFGDKARGLMGSRLYAALALIAALAGFGAMGTAPPRKESMLIAVSTVFASVALFVSL